MQRLEIKIKDKNLKKYPKIREVWYRDGRLFYQVDVNKSGSVKCKSVPIDDIEHFNVFQQKEENEVLMELKIAREIKQYGID